MADTLIAAARNRSNVFARWRQCDTVLAHDSLDPLHSPSKTAARSVQSFSGCTVDGTFSLYVTSPKFVLSRGRDLDSPYNTWFSGPTPPITPNGISMESAVFSRIRVRCQRTDRQNDDGTRPVRTGRLQALPSDAA